MAEDWFASIRSKPRAPTIRRKGPGFSPGKSDMANFILEVIDKDGTTPSLEDIQMAMGWQSVQSVKSLIRKYTRGKIDPAVIDEILAKG
jgi:hypothetical protein